MITLYRSNQDSFADRIQDRIENMVITHRVEYLPEGAEAYITENELTVSGINAIENYISTLEGEVNGSRMVSGDSCYINPNTGEVC